MEDRRAVRWLVRGMPIKLVIEDGTDRSIGERADLDGARSGGAAVFEHEGLPAHLPTNRGKSCHPIRMASLYLPSVVADDFLLVALGAT